MPPVLSAQLMPARAAPADVGAAIAVEVGNRIVE